MSASRSGQIVEQVIRPTGLLDPQVQVRPVEGQIDDLIGEINAADRQAGAGAGHHPDQENGRGPDRLSARRTASVCGICTHDIDTIERMEIIRDLRLGNFDVLVGINLLREGLDLPEVSLVAILDADKEGFLRSRDLASSRPSAAPPETPRAVVILYADKITPSMSAAMDETSPPKRTSERLQRGPWHRPQDHRQICPGHHRDLPRRRRQGRQAQAEALRQGKGQSHRQPGEGDEGGQPSRLEFEYAAVLRDQIIELRGKETAD